jgi:hypothetical protein
MVRAGVAGQMELIGFADRFQSIRFHPTLL